MDCNMPQGIINILKYIYNALLGIAPLLVVVFSTIDFLKAGASGKADEMSKNQQMFVKRLIVAAAVFFVFAIVKWSFTTIFKNIEGTSQAWACAEKILG